MILLVTLAVGLAATMFMLVARLGGESLSPPQGKATATLAAESAGLLMAVLVLLGFVLIRRAGRAVRGDEKLSPTDYVNAWKLSGHRMKLGEGPHEPGDDE
jgi:hypothetical protein